jgi:hypothetical protein
MSIPGSHDKPPPPLADLPPVEPPSAKFIMQLFVIPFLVVVVLVAFLLMVYMMFGNLATGGRDATEFVQEIRSANENRRWRAAFELASLIHNDPGLARSPNLLGELTALLDEELRKPEGQVDAPVAQYLAAAIGSFQTLRPKPGSPAEPAATLAGALRKRYPVEVRSAAAEALSRLAVQLEPAQRGPLDDPAVVGALVEASRAESPEVRQRAAYALGGFDQPEAVEALRERAAADPDRLARYNAAAALARRDDPAASPVLREMLSPPDLAAVFAEELKSDPNVARGRIEAIEREALRNLDQAVRAGHRRLAESLRPDLQALARSGSRTVQVEVKNLLQSLPNSP